MKQVQKNSFIGYILSDQVWGSNIKRISVIPKIISAHLCEPIHDIKNYSTSICPFLYGKCGKEGKKLQKLEYLENKKGFLGKIINAFHSFWKWKNINLIKSSGQKLTCWGVVGFFVFLIKKANSALKF